MKVAIMQPYIFPYIGFFQLLNAVDAFVFYDDVNFIKKGFINRNYILVNNRKFRFTIPCIGISQNKKINEIKINNHSLDISNLILTIEQNYKKAPFYNSVYPIIRELLSDLENCSISELSINSVVLVSNYLGINTKFYTSSIDFSMTSDLKKENRIIAICHELGAHEYYNLSGGKMIYSKDYFKKNQIKLSFIESDNLQYKQFGYEFVPWLSMIDILMFNSIESIKLMLNKYKIT